MKLNQLSFTVSSKEVRTVLQVMLAQATAHGGLPKDISEPDICIKKGQLVLSVKAKVGFMPMTISAALELRPTDDGEGIVVTLAKMSAGIISAQMIVDQVMGQISAALGSVPGCSVKGRDIILTKAALAAKVAWLAIPGKIQTCAIEGDTLNFVLG